MWGKQSNRREEEQSRWDDSKAFTEKRKLLIQEYVSPALVCQNSEISLNSVHMTVAQS